MRQVVPWSAAVFAAWWLCACSGGGAHGDSSCPSGLVVCDQGEGKFTCIEPTVSCESYNPPPDPPALDLAVRLECVVTNAPAEATIRVVVTNAGPNVADGLAVRLQSPAGSKLSSSSVDCRASLPEQIDCSAVATDGNPALQSPPPHGSSAFDATFDTSAASSGRFVATVSCSNCTDTDASNDVAECAFP